MPRSALDFIARDAYGIKGYIHPVDAFLFAAIAEHQARSGIEGAIAEIGVFHGRSFAVLLQTLRRDREKALAADLFEDGRRPDGGSAQFDRFLESLRKAGFGPEEVEIHRGSSHDLTAEQVRDRVGPVRFFHVDGGHLRDDVEADAALAAASLSERGMLVFDDFFNPEWPEVTTGLLAFLESRAGEFVPVAVTKAKLYVCRPGMREGYAALTAAAAAQHGFACQTVRFDGNMVLHVRQPLVQRAMFEALARVGQGRIAQRMLRRASA